MLSEIVDTRQIPDEGFRRWFTDEEMDLIVWYTREGGEVTGFQLCYDKQKRERALTWTVEGGFQHEKVDDGEDQGYAHKGTPILVPDGEFRRERVLKEFEKESLEVDPRLRKLVIERLSGYARTG